MWNTLNYTIDVHIRQYNIIVLEVNVIDDGELTQLSDFLLKYFKSTTAIVVFVAYCEDVISTLFFFFFNSLYWYQIGYSAKSNRLMISDFYKFINHREKYMKFSRDELKIMELHPLAEWNSPNCFASVTILEWQRTANKKKTNYN